MNIAILTLTVTTTDSPVHSPCQHIHSLNLRTDRERVMCRVRFNERPVPVRHTQIYPPHIRRTKSNTDYSPLTIISFNLLSPPFRRRHIIKLHHTLPMVHPTPRQHRRALLRLRLLRLSLTNPHLRPCLWKGNVLCDDVGRAVGVWVRVVRRDTACGVHVVRQATGIRS
jgi:hypothetical protein